MKTKFNTILKAGVVAAAMGMAVAAQAATVTPKTYQDFVSFDLSSENNIQTIFGSPFAGQVPVWNVSGYGNSDLIAFCIEPWVQGVPGNYQGASYTPDTNVQKLFASSYSSVTSGGYNADKGVAFQLALWEMMDNQNFASGDLVMVPTGDLTSHPVQNAAIVADADVMLQTALNYTGSLNGYQFVRFTSDAGGQSVLSAMPVPEADTWAMMAAGLGVLGLVKRRQKRSEKFA